MSYIDEKRIEGEQVVFRTKRHAVVLVFPIIAIALVVTLFGVRGFGLLLTLMTACWLAVGLAAHGASEFGVTDKRLLMRMGGVIRRRTVDTPLKNVEGIEVTQSALGGKLGYGTVTIRGTDGSSSSFPTIQQCLEFRDRVQEQIGRNGRAGDGPAQ
jgi:uncharacterized membrane protein YdbT with pleckstrin-like domain